MKIKTAWAIRSLALCLLFNLAFTAVIFYMASGLIDASHQWVSALSASGAPAMAANALMALGGLKALIAQTRGWLKPCFPSWPRRSLCLCGFSFSWPEAGRYEGSRSKVK